LIVSISVFLSDRITGASRETLGAGIALPGGIDGESRHVGQKSR
jgi:hypothetical protein